MSDLDILQERANDSLVQSRCDRRSLATLAWSLSKKGYAITSLSHLVRVIIEDCRARHLADGAQDILSYEDADDLLSKLGIRHLNTNSRQMSTYLRQQGKESLYLDGVPLESVFQPRVTKKMLKGRSELIKRTAQELLESGEVDRIKKKYTDPEKREFRKPDNLESAEEAQARRDRELADQKSELAKPPVQEENNEENND